MRWRSLLRGQMFRREQRSELRFITGATYAPFLFRDAEGRLTGFYIDLAKLISARLQATCRIVPKRQENRIPALLAREGDNVTAIVMTEERAAWPEVAFTNPIMHDYLTFIARKGFDRPLTPEGLAGLKLGVPAGSLEEDYAKTHYAGGPTITAITADDEEWNRILVEGEVDLALGFFVAWYAFLDSPLGQAFVSIGEPTSKSFPLGFALRSEDRPLLERVNAVLAEIRADGSFEALRVQWMSFAI